jgi:hypothetical protein
MEDSKPGTLVPLQLLVTEETRQGLKERAVRERRTMREIVESLITEYLEKQ